MIGPHPWSADFEAEGRLRYVHVLNGLDHCRDCKSQDVYKSKPWDVVGWEICIAGDTVDEDLCEKGRSFMSVGGVKTTVLRCTHPNSAVLLVMGS